MCLSNLAKKCLSPQHIWFVLKNLFLSFLKIRNIKTLFYRFCTIAMVLIHYFFVEGITEEQMVHNEKELVTLVVTWHIIFMTFKIVEETRRKKNDIHFHMIATIIGILAAGTFLTVILTPFLAWFNCSITQLDTSYWTLRYFMLFLYIVMNIFINVFPLVNNFMFFLSDGIILSQITSIYLFNEFSMSALLTVLPFLFVLQNHGLIRGIKNFARDEKNQKLSFVRLIGRHDAVFLFVIYTIFTMLFNIVDFFSSNYIFGVNLWYIVYALYVFGKLMDNKSIGGLKYASFVSVIVYALIYCYTLRYHTNPFPDRKFPLYNPIATTVNATIGNDTMNMNTTAEGIELP